MDSSRRARRRCYKISNWLVKERTSGKGGEAMNKYSGSNFDEFLKDEGILEAHVLTPSRP